MPELTSSKRILSVSELTDKIKLLLEDQFPMVWIFGEISNLKVPTSGHAYFTLKDSNAQIAAVMFKGQTRNLRFSLEDGISIVGLGRISLYQPRGTYQIILEYAEPKGLGALQFAFEQLKGKLAQEGLFDPGHKKPIPLLPDGVCVVTSPTGAVIRDILNIIQRRCPGLCVEILPVGVQGAQAADQIAHAIAVANGRAHSAVIILARGGGSLEDLAPFNSETVARAIFASSIPVISAIGHETDYTIADFVADLRAPTPSAAAEIVAPLKSGLQARSIELRQRCLNSLLSLIGRYRDKQVFLRRALVHPMKRVQELHLRTDDFTHRLRRMTAFYPRQQAARHKELQNRLIYHHNPKYSLDSFKQKLYVLKINLLGSIEKSVEMSKQRFNIFHAALMTLNPKSVLQRGYSITRTIPDHRVVTHADGVEQGQALEILLYEGSVTVSVTAKKEER